MAKYRKSRVDTAFAEACSRIVRDIKDPRVTDVMLSVLSADVSADLKNAKVYYSVYGETDDKELAKGLKSAVPYVRSRIAEELNLRVTPEIVFVRDDGIRRGAEISALLKKIEPELAAADAREAAEAEAARRAAEEAEAESEAETDEAETPDDGDDTEDADV